MNNIIIHQHKQVCKHNKKVYKRGSLAGTQQLGLTADAAQARASAMAREVMGRPRSARSEGKAFPGQDFPNRFTRLYSK